MTCDSLYALADGLRMKREKHLRQYSLTGPQYELLREVLLSDGMKLGQVADLLRCSRGNLTGIADRLERAGWLMRERSTEDRRVVNITIPADKRAKVEHMVADVGRLEAEWAKYLPPTLDELVTTLAS